MLSKDDISTKAVVWITHSPEQGRRIGTRFVTLTGGSMKEEDPAENRV